MKLFQPLQKVTAGIVIGKAVCFLLAVPAFPFETNQAASVVIGQPNMTSHSPNQSWNWTDPGYPTSRTLWWPGQLQVQNGRLFVADYHNNRVLIYNSVPAADNAAADAVVGQPNMTSNYRNQQPVGEPPWVPGSNTLYYPDGVYVSPDGKMLIGDSFNNRSLVYNAVPAINNQSADVAIGQSAFTEYHANQLLPTPDKYTHYEPRHLFVHSDGRVLIADRFNNRVLIFDSIPTSHNAKAGVVVGQPDFWSNQTNQGIGWPSSETLYEPTAVFVDSSGRMYVTDTGNNRVLIFNQIPSSNNAFADIVIGQPDFFSGEPNRGLVFCAGNTLDGPFGAVFADGNRLYIPDSNNNRVLIYEPIPTASGVSATRVLGQPDMNSNWVNQFDPQPDPNNPPTPTARTLYWPDGVYYSQNKLLVADTNNNRVLIYHDPDPQPTPTPSPPPEPTHINWSLPAGATMIDGVSFDTFVLISNPGETAAAVEVTFSTHTGPIAWTEQTISPNSRSTIKVNDYVGGDLPAVSTIVKSLEDIPVMCERAMYWGGVPGNWDGGHNTIGIDRPGNVWNLPEGATHLFDMYVHVLNPEATWVTATAVFMNQEGVTWEAETDIPPQANWTIDVWEEVGSQPQISTQVIASGPVAVERTMYLRNGAGDWIGGHCSRGLAEAATEWFLAEGANHIFDHYVLASNPSDQHSAQVLFTFMDQDGDFTTHTHTLGPQSRYTVNANNIPGWENRTQVSTRVESQNGIDIFVERAMYWPKGGPNAWADGHDSIGTAAGAMSEKWYLPEGATHLFNQYVLVANPSGQTAQVKFTFMGAAGVIDEYEVNIPPGRRYTVNVNNRVGSEGQVSTVVESNIPVVAERAMYWPKGPAAGWRGGHGTVGIAEGP